FKIIFIELLSLEISSNTISNESSSFFSSITKLSSLISLVDFTIKEFTASNTQPKPPLPSRLSCSKSSRYLELYEFIVAESFEKCTNDVIRPFGNITLNFIVYGDDSVVLL
ncbi:hypothetical protein DERP_011912, partial [Dermatophagoides pteronyssinus]